MENRAAPIHICDVHGQALPSGIHPNSSRYKPNMSSLRFLPLISSSAMHSYVVFCVSPVWFITSKRPLRGTMRLLGMTCSRSFGGSFLVQENQSPLSGDNIALSVTILLVMWFSSNDLCLLPNLKEMIDRVVHWDTSMKQGDTTHCHQRNALGAFYNLDYNKTLKFIRLLWSNIRQATF